MKVLIWIGCLILNYIVQSISSAIVSCIPVSNDTDVLLRATLNGLLSAASIGFFIWLAIRLCKKLDWYRVMKKANEAGMTVSEYGRQGLSEEFLAKVEELFNTVPYEVAKTKLGACVSSGKISKEQYIILLNEYQTIK